jgi:hypothetical protein
MVDQTHEERLYVGVKRNAGHRGQWAPLTLILGDRRSELPETVDAWLAPSTSTSH